MGFCKVLTCPSNDREHGLRGYIHFPETSIFFVSQISSEKFRILGEIAGKNTYCWWKQWVRLSIELQCWSTKVCCAKISIQNSFFGISDSIDSDSRGTWGNIFLMISDSTVSYSRVS